LFTGARQGVGHLSRVADQALQIAEVQVEQPERAQGMAHVGGQEIRLPCAWPAVMTARADQQIDRPVGQ